MVIKNRQKTTNVSDLDPVSGVVSRGIGLRIRFVRIFADISYFWSPALAMRKTDSAMIFLMHFTLTLYRDFHVVIDKYLGRQTTHKLDGELR